MGHLTGAVAAGCLRAARSDCGSTVADGIFLTAGAWQRVPSTRLRTPIDWRSVSHWVAANQTLAAFILCVRTTRERRARLCTEGWEWMEAREDLPSYGAPRAMDYRRTNASVLAAWEQCHQKK